jgi:hypothetical protein
MGRKNKLKSTFIDKVIPGTIWICHNKDRILIGGKLDFIQKGDICVVLSHETRYFRKEIPMVKCLSQRWACVYLTTLEDFYFNYHELPLQKQDSKNKL